MIAQRSMRAHTHTHLLSQHKLKLKYLIMTNKELRTPEPQTPMQGELTGAIRDQSFVLAAILRDSKRAQTCGVDVFT